MLSNTEEHYGLIARMLHWIIGVGIIALCILGWTMTTDFMSDTPIQGLLYMLHKATGVALLVAATLRLLWSLTNPKPRLLRDLASWQQSLAHGIHRVLYLLMIAIPFSGYALSATGGYRISFFGFFDVPMLIQEHEFYFKSYGHLVHEYLVWVMVAILTLHILAVVKHNFIDKDATLTRMLGVIGNRD